MSKSRQLSDAINSVDISESAPADAVTLDASGKLLVGTTTVAPGSTQGVIVYEDGRVFATSDGTYAGYFNRLTSDGDIALFRKDGTTVGSIGTSTSYSGQMAINATSSNLIINANGSDYAFDSTQFYPLTAGRNLGLSGNEFGDLRLSGGVYLGGTGAANYLDDYEEGFWTPTLTDITNTATTDANTGGYYVKTGSMVFVTGHLFVTNMNSVSGVIFLGGIPFTTKSSANFFTRGGGSVGRVDNLNRASDGQAVYISIDSNSNYLGLYIDDTTNENTEMTSSQIDGVSFRIYFSATYVTDS